MKCRLNENATLYSNPSLTAPTVVEVHAGDEIMVGKSVKRKGQNWHHVTLADGTVGYISPKTMVYEINPTTYSYQFTSLDGDTVTFCGPSERSIVSQIREAALAGTLRIKGDEQYTRRLQMGTYCSESTSEYSRLCIHPQIASIYSPLRFRMVKAIKRGAIIGILCESANQCWLLFRHYDSIAPVLLYLVPIAFLLGFFLDDWLESTITKWLLPGIAMALFMGHGASMQHHLNSISTMLAPTFAATVVSVIIGATLGVTIAAGLAGMTILRKPQQITSAPGVIVNLQKLRKVTNILFISFAILLLAYLGVTRQWPVAVEMYIRKDLHEHPPNR